jgi:hypothetical protein
MYPHVTQFETRSMAWQQELQLRDTRRKPRPRLLARLPLVSRTPAAARPPRTGSVGGA